jgi:hypothetical protein
VWAIDEVHSILYLFPRECPRIVVWPTGGSSAEDRAEWLGGTAARAVAFVERRWIDRIAGATLHRYEMPSATFEDIGDVGMWVSRVAVRPSGVETITDLTGLLECAGVELRPRESLTDLRPIWRTSLHASGVRLRNAAGWGAPAWPHSKSPRDVSLPPAPARSASARGTPPL